MAQCSTVGPRTSRQVATGGLVSGLGGRAERVVGGTLVLLKLVLPTVRLRSVGVSPTDDNSAPARLAACGLTTSLLPPASQLAARPSTGGF